LDWKPWQYEVPENFWDNPENAKDFLADAAGIVNILFSSVKIFIIRHIGNKEPF
jgi:hypothetical protein